jgi:hypothetical protein
LHNLQVVKHIGKANRGDKIALREAITKFCRQLSSQLLEQGFAGFGQFGPLLLDAARVPRHSTEKRGKGR